jgi:hypothetical protein
MREEAWTTWVIEAATLHGWRVSHGRPARTGRGWRTPVQGHIGAPDLLLARDGDVLLIELKSNTGRLRPDQDIWLNHLGPYGGVWRPRDANLVLARLRRTA